MSNISIGYIVSYSYLVLVGLLSFAAGKCTFLKDKIRLELSRKVIHVACGMGWVILKVFLESSVHSVIIVGSFILLGFLSRYANALGIQRSDTDNGLLYYLSVMLLLCAVSYKWPGTFDSFGVAIMCLALGDGFAALIGTAIGKHKWKAFPNRSLEGTFGGLLVTLAVIIPLSFVLNMNVSVLGIIVSCTAGMIFELFAGEFDNLLIPETVFLISLLFTVQ